MNAAIRILDTHQPDEWLEVLGRARQRDFYFLPGYHAMAERRGEGYARLFVFEKDGYMLAVPLLLRAIAGIPGLPTEAGEWMDATSVYGYAGPLASHADVPVEIVHEFQDALTATLREQRVVTVFSRLHPLLPQSPFIAGLGDTHPNGLTISIDLTLPQEAQRAQYLTNARKRIDRHFRTGFSVERDEGFRTKPQFLAIYNETMRRVGASPGYFVDASYFDELSSALGPSLELFYVRMPDGEIGAAGLFTLVGDIVQFHLSGTRDAALKLSLTGTLIDGVRKWASEAGAKAFHLGGGVGSRMDSLFEFKSGFSDRRHDFLTWRWIVEPEVHRQIQSVRERWLAANGFDTPSTFFPTYRAPIHPRAEVPPAEHQATQAAA